MNTQLVETLVQIVNALTPEEKALLKKKIDRPSWEEEYQKLVEVREKIFARRGGKPFDPPLDEYIQMTRDERTAEQDELIRTCFVKEKKA